MTIIFKTILFIWGALLLFMSEGTRSKNSWQLTVSTDVISLVLIFLPWVF